MNLHNIIQKNMDKISNYYGSFTYSDKVNQNGHNKLIQDVENAQLSIIQAIDEWAKKQKPPVFFQQDGMSKDWLQDDAYMVALSDLRSFLEEAITKLK